MLKVLFAVFAGLSIGASAAHAQSASFERTNTHGHEHGHPQGNLPVTIQVTGLKSTQGQLLFAIYDNGDGFPNNATPVKTLVIKTITSSTMSADVDLPAGTYAVSFIADKNDDGKLDTGVFGIPSEGFGFSNNPTITFGAPSFDKCAVDVQSAHQVISIKADYL